MKTKAQQLGITTFPYEERDKNGEVTYIETSDGYWAKYEYDNKGILTYREYSNGVKKYTIK